MNLDKRTQLWITLVLVGLMAATRGQHFASLTHLPSASLAIFFLAGFYVRRAGLFLALLVEAVVVDYLAISWGGVDSFCVTPAYAFLLPAYGSVWLAGRWFARRYSFGWSALAPFSIAAIAGTVASELFSSGGFYFFGGRFASPTLAEFTHRLAQYFPQVLSGFAFWVAIAAVVHVALTLAQGTARRNDLKA